MPAMTVRAFPSGIQKMGSNPQDWDTNTFKATLHTSTYSPNYDTNTFQSDTSNELSTAGGYTNGGLTISSPTLTVVAANSLAQVAATTTAYSVGQIVRPSAGNGFVYVCAVAGTSGGSAPTWPTVLYTTVADGGVTWCCIGRGVLKWTFTSPQWTSFSAGPFSILVVACTTPGSAATNPLICAGTFASPQTGGGGNFDATVDGGGVVVWPY